MTGPPSITVSALSRDTCDERRVLLFLSWKVLILVLLLFLLMRPRPAFQNPAVERWFHQPSIRSLYCDHDSLFRLPDCSGGKAPNQPNDDLLLHQGGPRAALHANQLRITGLATQHPVHSYRQLSGDCDFGHATAPAQLQALIVLL